MPGLVPSMTERCASLLMVRRRSCAVSNHEGHAASEPNRSGSHPSRRAQERAPHGEEVLARSPDDASHRRESHEANAPPRHPSRRGFWAAPQAITAKPLRRDEDKQGKDRRRLNARYGLSSSPRAARGWPCPGKSTSRFRRACRRRLRGSHPCSLEPPWRRLLP